jgi:hypothetical protein
MPTELRRQPSPRSFDPSPRTAKRPALALVRRQPNATEQTRESEQPPSALLALRLASGNTQAATVASRVALWRTVLAVPPNCASASCPWPAVGIWVNATSGLWADLPATGSLVLSDPNPSADLTVLCG